MQDRSLVKVVNYRAKVPADGIIINTTSKSNNWSKDLSPFFLGPIELYNGYTSQTFESSWQFCKLYAIHADADGNPTPAYFEWARAGWNNPVAVRFPMGRGAKPLYSLWEGEKLGYVEARKKIYCQLYSTYVEETPAWEQLVEVYNMCLRTNAKLYLRDFDGYDKRDQTYEQVLNNPNKKMGHAFVLAMKLEGKECW
jgi:hypothetical protein